MGLSGWNILCFDSSGFYGTVPPAENSLYQPSITLPLQCVIPTGSPSFNEPPVTRSALCQHVVQCGVMVLEELQEGLNLDRESLFGSQTLGDYLFWRNYAPSRCVDVGIEDLVEHRSHGSIDFTNPRTKTFRGTVRSWTCVCIVYPRTGDAFIRMVDNYFNGTFVCICLHIIFYVGIPRMRKCALAVCAECSIFIVVYFIKKSLLRS